jgi:S-DNA-T family DNA segregation ATPase FtsK/SpoIIIE
MLIAFVALCLYLLLALMTYSVNDPGWSSTGRGGDIANIGGPAGAFIADIFFSLFGYLSYLFPFMLGYQAWRVFQLRDQDNPFDWVMLCLRFVGLCLVMVSGTGLVAMHTGFETDSLAFTQGGILGSEIGRAIDGVFGFIGGSLILAALFLFGLTIFTDLSWFAVMDGIGALVMNSGIWLRNGFHTFATNRRERREAKQAQHQRWTAVEKNIAKEATRIPPTIAEVPKKPLPGPRVQKEKQGSLFETTAVGELPKISLLDIATARDERGYSKESLEAMSRLLELKLQDFGITAEVVSVLPGPVVTRFEIQPAAGVKVNRITNLAKDLARSLAVISVRVVEVIPGKSVVGIEIPNEHREMVRLSEVLASPKYEMAKSPITLALGHDISGQPVIVDLAKMPHLLVAGTTGSGKSVGINVMLLSLLYKSTPKDVRLILVDPKMLELSVYEGIPHLLTPVITDMKDAANGLRWCVGEMERRYKLMATMGVRNLAGFNRKVEDAAKAGKPLSDPLWNPEIDFSGAEQAPLLETLPAIVVVIDEFADMMMIVGKKVEQLIARIAQKARAAGIHLILATQRPSVDVITGLIKANVPTRIGFQVSSKIDSRTILDQGGAEQLLGHGDMLYLPPGTSVPQRVHGAFVDDAEVHRVVADWQKRGAPNYIDGIIDESNNTIPVPGMATEGGDEDGDAESDPLYDEAVEFVTQSRRASISSVQRKLRVGYNRAARIIEAMEIAGVVTEMQSNGNREVIAPPPRS